MPEPIERVSNGQFAPGKRKPGGRPFKKGEPRHPNAGRKKGTPNKITRAVKEFLKELVDDADVQAAIKDRIMRGDAVAFFRALEHVAGKPTETVNAQVKADVTYRWEGE